MFPRFRSIPAHVSIPVHQRTRISPATLVDGALGGFVIGALSLLLTHRFDPGAAAFWFLEGVAALAGSLAWTAFRIRWGGYLDARRRYVEARVEARLVLEKIEHYRERGYLDPREARRQSAEVRRWLSKLRKELSGRGRRR